ncbi:MAG: hypothetical protein WDM89_19645 [Rhizomicrobium sp.]
MPALRSQMNLSPIVANGFRRSNRPRSVDFEKELPRHPTGKLYKRLIRDRYWAGATPGSFEGFSP